MKGWMLKEVCRCQYLEICRPSSLMACRRSVLQCSYLVYMQDMDQGVLFCTYSLLIQKSTSGKDVRQAMGRNPEGFGHRNILDIHERTAAQEASKGELEFGGDQHLSVALL